MADDNIFPPAGWLEGEFKPVLAALSGREAAETARLWLERRSLDPGVISKLKDIRLALNRGEDKIIILECALLLGMRNLPPRHRLLVLGVRARARLRCRHFEGAADDFSRVLDEAPRDVPSLINRGIAQYELRRFSRAIEDFARGIARQDHADHRIWRAAARSELRDIAGARVDLRRASALEPTNLVALKWRAAISTGGEGDDPETALAELALAIAGLPPDHRLWERRANILATLGRTAEAIVELDAGLPLAVEREDARRLRVSRAELKAALGDEQGALADYDEALAEGPLDSGYESARIKLLQRMGRLDAALARADALVEREGNWHAARCLRAELLVAMGAFDRAEVDLKYCVETWKYYPSLALEYAALLERRGALEEALAVLTPYRLWYATADLLLRLAELNQALGRPAAAVVELNHLIEVHPRSIDGLRLRARVNADLGRLDAARADLMAVLALEEEVGQAGSGEG